jgi:CBS domain-containing protein
MMNLEVRTIMTTDPVVAHPSQTIDEVTQLMIDTRHQQLPVVEEGQLKGMITSYDLWKATRNGMDVNTKIEGIMTKKVLRITPKDKVGTAAELFADSRFKTLPVVNLKNELKGVVTAFDVIKSAFKEEYPRPILFEEVFA